MSTVSVARITTAFGAAHWISRRILDDEQPVIRRDPHHLIDDGIRQGRLARGRAANDQDVPALSDSPFDRFSLAARHDPLALASQGE